MRTLVRILIGLLMPVVLIAGGGGVMGVAMEYEWMILFWVGLAMVGAGLVWGLFIFFVAEAGSPFD
ncbi:MAG: hypothetical protein AAFX86_02270 [Pseudomonadota bacterium]